MNESLRRRLAHEPDTDFASPSTAVFRCPYCQASGLPVVEHKVSTAGWVLFVLLLLSFIGIIVCWIPLVFMKDEVRRCRYCGMRLG